MRAARLSRIPAPAINYARRAAVVRVVAIAAGRMPHPLHTPHLRIVIICKFRHYSAASPGIPRPPLPRCASGHCAAMFAPPYGTPPRAAQQSAAARPPFAHALLAPAAFAIAALHYVLIGCLGRAGHSAGRARAFRAPGRAFGQASHRGRRRRAGLARRFAFRPARAAGAGSGSGMGLAGRRACIASPHSPASAARRAAARRPGSHASSMPRRRRRNAAATPPGCRCARFRAAGIRRQRADCAGITRSAGSGFAAGFRHVSCIAAIVRRRARRSPRQPSLAGIPGAGIGGSSGDGHQTLAPAGRIRHC